jgi:hypothetical protein
LDLSKIRITIFSPNNVGSVDTRKSTAALTKFHFDVAVLRHAALGDIQISP